MLVFDTNVLLYGADRDSEHHEPCRSRIEAARRNPSPAFLTWNICQGFALSCSSGEWRCYSPFVAPCQPGRAPEA